MDTTMYDIPSDTAYQTTHLNDRSAAEKYQQLIDTGLINNPTKVASSQHIMTFEVDLPCAESARAVKSTTTSNTSTRSRVESMGINSQPATSKEDPDNSKCHLKIESFHWRDFVFDLPAPVYADSYGDALPTYDPITTQQKREIQQNSYQDPRFDFYSPIVADDADTSITNHCHNARYFRHLDILKSQLGEEMVYNKHVDHRKGRVAVRPGQVQVDNAFGLYEVEHWPGARDQVIWTKWTISAVKAEQLGLPMPAVPNEAKNMFRLAVADGLQFGWQACWMMTHGSRLYSAIFRSLRAGTLGRNIYRPKVELIGDIDHTEWIEEEWANSNTRYNSINFGGHDFSRTQAMRDMLVVKRGYLQPRKRFGLPVRFGKGAKLELSVLWSGEHLPNKDVSVTLIPVAEAAPTLTVNRPRPASEASQSNQQAKKSATNGKAGSSTSMPSQKSKRHTLQHQPARSSSLRNSVKMTSNGDSPIPKNAPHPVLEVGERRSPSSAVAASQKGSRSASVVASQAPGAIVEARGRTSGVTSPTFGNLLDQFFLRTEQASSSTESRTTIPATPFRQVIATTSLSQSPASHGRSNAPTGTPSANVAAQQHPPNPFWPQRFKVIYCRLLPQITPERVSTDLNAMKHNGHDEMVFMRILREIRHHIALGLWSLPAWNLRSEFDVDTMADRVLQEQFAGVLNDWRQNVLGLGYDAIRQKHQRPANILLVVMAHTLHQANPMPPNASIADRNFWQAAYELEARRWRMEMMQTWCRHFSSQRQLAIQTRGNLRHKHLDDGTAVNLWTSRIERLG